MEGNKSKRSSSLSKPEECHICKNRFRTPKVLPCVHCFCEDCLQTLADENASRNQIDCPTCGTTCDIPKYGVKCFQTNFHIANRIEKEDLLSRLIAASETRVNCDSCENAEGSNYCFECDFFICTDCLSRHKRFPSLRSHSLTSVSAINPHEVFGMWANIKKPLCTVHPTETMRFFCKTCSKLICRDCTIIQHTKPDHECVEAANQFQDAKASLVQQLNASYTAGKKTSTYISEGEKGLKQTKLVCESVQQEIKSCVENSVSKIERQLKSQMEDMFEAIENKQTNQNANIKKRVDLASNWLSRVTAAQEMTEQLVAESNVWNLLSLSNDLTSAFTHLMEECADFHWQRSDLQDGLPWFTPQEMPEVVLGYYRQSIDAAVADTSGNFIICTFDYETSELNIAKLLKQYHYDFSRAQSVPSYTWTKPYPKHAKVKVVLDGNNHIVVGLGRWLARFTFSTSSTTPDFLETSSRASACIVALFYSNYRGTWYVAHEKDRNIKLLDPGYFGSRGNSTQETKITVPQTCLPIQDIFVFQYEMILAMGREYQLSRFHLRDTRCSPFNEIPVNQLLNTTKVAVFKGKYNGNSTMSDGRRVDVFSCYIVWNGSIRLWPNADEASYTVAEYDSRTAENISVWGIPSHVGVPLACCHDQQTGVLEVVDKFGRVTSCEKISP